MECSICFDAYDEQLHRPLFLNCGHTFCKLCLQGLERGGITCPVCNAKIPIESLEQLPINYSVLSVPAGAEGQPIPKDTSVLMCPKHPKKAKFICHCCDCPVCSACFIQHKAHEIQEIELYLSKSLDSMYRRATEMEEGLNTQRSNLVSITSEVSKNHASAVAELEAVYREALEEIGREFLVNIETLRICNEENRENTEQALRANQTQLSAISDVSRTALILRHSYTTQAQLFEKLRQFDSVLNSAEAEKGKLEYCLSTLEKPEKVLSYLGKLHWDQLDYGEEKDSGSLKSSESIYEEFKRSASAVYPQNVLKGSLDKSALLRLSEARHPTQAKWSYVGRHTNKAKLFRNSDNKTIEEAYQQGLPGVELRKHRVDFKAMVKTNKRSKKTKRVVRQVN
jgi:hypothetical protein